MTAASDYRRDRRRLVAHLRSAGFDDLTLLHAFDSVPRHRFVPEAVSHRAYEDAALPLGHGQTISRPSVHAMHLTLAELTGKERVLEVGTGSGFQTALLSRLCERVFSVERVEPLAELARQRLERLGVDNVTLRAGDGSAGWPEHAPYDVVLVGAAAPEVPDVLCEQLVEGGRLIVPVGDGESQELRRVWRHGEAFEQEVVDRARFVPLLGEQGW